MFAKRLISAIVLLALAGIVLIGGGTILLFASIFVTLAGTYEILKLDDMHKTIPGCISYVSVISFYLALYLWKGDYFEIWFVITMVMLLASYVFTYPKYHAKHIGICFIAIFYVGVLASYIYQIRCLEYGHWLVWLVLACASGTDTFAYLTGILIGKHHFSELSPKKTIEGCIGGVIGSVLIALIYSFVVPQEVAGGFRIDMRLLFVLIGVIGSVISQIGDLVASALKRNYGVKDYSNLIPGHGGILDRFDSIIFVAPIVYFLLFGFLK